MLAAMGYVAVGADIYDLAVGSTVEELEERGAYVNQFLSDPPMYVKRIRAAVDAVKALSFVDEGSVGLTGYCFGGSGVVFDAFDDSSLKLDVSFHGGLGTKPDITTTPPMQPYVSYQSGGADESPVSPSHRRTKHASFASRRPHRACETRLTCLSVCANRRTSSGCRQV
jgi:dienelactone hydrolase